MAYIKVVKRSPVTKSVLGFILISIFLNYLVAPISRGFSIFNLEIFKEVLVKDQIFLLFSIILSFYIYTVKKKSYYLLLIFVGIVLFNTTQMFLFSYSKMTLLLLFFYLFLFIYFFIFWSHELKLANYHQGFHPKQIGKKGIYNLSVKIHSTDGKSFSGEITNLDRKSCFIILDGNIYPKGKVILEIDYLERKFKERGFVITHSSFGIGIQFRDFSDDHFLEYRWDEFYAIIRDRGYQFPIG